MTHLHPCWREDYLAMLIDIKRRQEVLTEGDRAFVAVVHQRVTWGRRPTPAHTERLEELWDRATEG